VARVAKLKRSRRSEEGAYQGGCETILTRVVGKLLVHFANESRLTDEVDVPPHQVAQIGGNIGYGNSMPTDVG
jgi:hypothetical protein